MTYVGEWIDNAVKTPHQIHSTACPLISFAVEPGIGVAQTLDLNVGVKLFSFSWRDQTLHSFSSSESIS